MREKPTKCIDCNAYTSRFGVKRCRKCFLINPIVIRGRPPKDFWTYVEKTPTCWLWIGAKSNRYGMFRWKGRSHHSQRVAWEIYNGPIPDGFHVCHKCDVPSCVNPEHLFVGTASDNMRDMGSKGRHRIGDRKGEKHPLAKLTTEQVIEIRRLYKRHSHDFNTYTLAKQFKVSPGSIGTVVRREEWTHI